jgi:hypothetical protein
MPNKKINQLDTRTGAALTDLILIGDPTSGTSFKLTATDFKTLLNNVPYTGATTNVNLGAFNLTAASIIKSGGTSSQFLKADGSVDSSTYTPTTRTLTINGTSFDLSADRSWTIAAGITGSGANGQVAYWNGTSSQTGSNNLFWNSANSRLGIATNSPSYKLDIAAEASGNTGIRIAGLNTNAAVVDLFSSTTHVGAFFGTGSSLSFGTYQSSQVSLESYSTGGVSLRTNNGANAHIRFYAGNASASQSPEIARFFSTTGNLVLQNGGTFSDGGQRLQVQGDAFIKGSGATSATNALLVQNSSGTEMFTVRNDGRVLMQSVGSISVGGTITFNNTVSIASIGSSPTILGGGRLTFAGGGPQQNYIRSVFETLYQTATGTTTGTTISDNLTINLTGSANGTAISFLANPTITSLVSTSTYRAFQWNNNLGWGLYGAGTANNYLGGRLGIATTSPTYRLDIGAEASGNTGIRIAGLNTNAAVVDLFSSTTHVGAFFGTGSSLSFGTYQSSQVSLESYSTGGVSLRTSNGANAHIRFYAGNASSAQSPEIARFVSTTGNLLLNTTSDAGYRLDVNGTARVQSKLSLSAGTTSNAQINLASSTAPTSPNNGDIWFDGSDLKIRVGGLTRTIVLL